MRGSKWAAMQSHWWQQADTCDPPVVAGDARPGAGFGVAVGGAAGVGPLQPAVACGLHRVHHGVPHRGDGSQVPLHRCSKCEAMTCG